MAASWRSRGEDRAGGGPPEAGTGWRRPALGGLAALAAFCAVVVLAFRSRRPSVMRAVRGFNKRVLNPAMLRLAGRRHVYAARLEHLGRRSGRWYATPVVARAVPGGFAVPLPYGADVDWCRNLRAAGGGVLVVGGVRHPVREPHVVAAAAVRPQLGGVWRWTSSLYDIDRWVTVRVAEVAEPPVARSAEAAGTRTGAAPAGGTAGRARG